MSYAADLTADLANWIAGLIREMLTEAPPPRERNTTEWLLERLDRAGAPDQGSATTQSLTEQSVDSLEGL